VFKEPIVIAIFRSWENTMQNVENAHANGILQFIVSIGLMPLKISVVRKLSFVGRKMGQYFFNHWHLWCVIYIIAIGLIRRKMSTYTNYIPSVLGTQRSLNSKWNPWNLPSLASPLVSGRTETVPEPGVGRASCRWQFYRHLLPSSAGGGGVEFKLRN